MSKASQISAAIAARIAAIVDASPDYATDVGRLVLRGRERLDESLLPCSVIVESDDTIEERQPHTDKYQIALPFFIEGHSACTPDNPNDRAHEIIADFKKAIFSGDPRLGGLAKDIRYIGRSIRTREDGLGIVAAGIEIEVVFIEGLAAP